MPQTIVTGSNDRLDRLCYAYYGSTANRQVEITLDANPGLDSYGMLLPQGISITFPDKALVQSTTIIKQIKLWE